MNQSISDMVGALRRVVTEGFGAVDGIKGGTLDRGDAVALSSQLGRVNTAVSTELKVRLAAPKIAAQEAKLIENEQRQQLATA